MTLTEPDAADVCVVGGSAVGTAVADRDQSVSVVTDDPAGAEPAGVTVHTVETVDAETLEAAGIGEETVVVVANRSDRRNLLLAGLVRSRFDARRVIACVNDPSRTAAFEEAGIETLCVQAAVGAQLSEQW